MHSINLYTAEMKCSNVRYFWSITYAYTGHNLSYFLDTVILPVKHVS